MEVASEWRVPLLRLRPTPWNFPKLCERSFLLLQARRYRLYNYPHNLWGWFHRPSFCRWTNTTGLISWGSTYSSYDALQPKTWRIVVGRQLVSFWWAPSVFSLLFVFWVRVRFIAMELHAKIAKNFKVLKCIEAAWKSVRWIDKQIRFDKMICDPWDSNRH